MFDLDVVHQIALEMAPADWDRLRADRSGARYPATVVFDGQRLETIGVRQKGVSSRSMGTPGLSLKFDELVAGQRLHGLDRLVLDNSLEDASLLNKHLIYGLYRRAGLPAARLSYGVVTVNGRFLGVYLVKEAIDREFLACAFGREHRRGNLYEGQETDFATDPMRVELKHEQEEGRRRDDLLALAALLSAPPASDFPARLATLVDVDQVLTAYAIEAVMANIDNYHYNSNNYYLYANPRDGRFVLIPHGADHLFDINDHGGIRLNATFDPYRLPADPPFWHAGRLAVRLREHPALDARFRQAVTRVARELWNRQRLEAEVTRIETLLHRSPLITDLRSFDAFLPLVRELIANRTTFLQSHVKP